MIQAKKKGNILESIVASLHEDEGVCVERNVRLRPQGGKRRNCEIDVLITSQVIGYPVRFAIECKNYDKVIGLGKINEFLGKLSDVGIPSQMGIYVTTKAYTKDAVERATRANLRLLLLSGLDDNGMSSKLIDSIQSVLYLQPIVTEVSVSNYAETDTAIEDMMLIFKDGKLQYSIPDLIWYNWQNGIPHSEIGLHELEFEIPDGWQQVIDGQPFKPISIKAKILVRGYVVLIGGRATQYHLFDVMDKRSHKIQSKADFDIADGKYPLQAFNSEASFDEFWQKRSESIKLSIGRIRLPRIKWANIYWPVSKRVQTQLNDFIQSKGQNLISKSDLEEFVSGIEGDDLAAVWDPF